MSKPISKHRKWNISWSEWHKHWVLSVSDKSLNGGRWISYATFSKKEDLAKAMISVTKDADRNYLSLISSKVTKV